MRDNMIERVARYICKASYQDNVAPEGGDVQAHVDGMWVAWIDEARELLELMREPTDLMVDAGLDTDPDEDGDLTPRDIWPAMINAALREKAR